MKSKINFSQILFLIVFIAFLSSCVTHKQLILLKDKSAQDTGSKDSNLVYNNFLKYKIQTGDVINIKISSTSSSAVEIFNNEFGQATTNQSSEASVFLNGYVVNEDGNIELPLVGPIHIQGLNTNEINQRIKEKMEVFVNYVTISVKLTSYRITVLGEVKNPGTFTIYNTNINILQALGLAGDITDVGDRHYVKLIRKTEEGQLTIIINMASSSLLNSENFYLMPNDIIYVQPLKAKVVKINNPTLQVTISLVTLLFLVLNFTKK